MVNFCKSTKLRKYKDKHYAFYSKPFVTVPNSCLTYSTIYSEFSSLLGFTSCWLSDSSFTLARTQRRESSESHFSSKSNCSLTCFQWLQNFLSDEVWSCIWNMTTYKHLKQNLFFPYIEKLNKTDLCSGVIILQNWPQRHRARNKHREATYTNLVMTIVF